MTLNPKGFEGCRCSVVEEQVRELFRFMKRDSGPGHPWISLAKTKGEVIDRYSPLLVEAVLGVVALWANTPHGTLPEDPCELVRRGFVAPVRTFVKNEPHGKEKISTGRLRLICMVPIHIVMAEMLVFGVQNSEEIAHYDSIPSKPGLGLADDAQIEQVCEEVGREIPQGVSEADVSGFDFSVSEEFFKYDARRRVDLIEGGASESFTNAVYNAHHSLCRSVFALSDGRMFKQLEPGVMKSGRYVTSSTNSFIRVLMARSIGSRWCIAMGDDSLEATVPDAIAKYAELGVKVKFYRNVTTEFEFCSHTFKGGKAWPANPGKMYYSLLNQKGGFSQLFTQFQQWFFEMRHHPDVDLWVQALERSGWAAQKDGRQEEECLETVSA